MDQATHDLLVTFAYGFLSLVLPVLAGTLGALAIQGIRLLEAKIKVSQPDLYAQMDAVIKMGVFAAEQAGIAGYIADKKAFALSVIQAELEARGIKNFDITQLEAKIEAAVYAEINKDKPQG